MSKNRRKMVMGFDPIDTMLRTIEEVLPMVNAVVHFMDDEFFNENGYMEWATAESEYGNYLIFVNPNRTITQIIMSIAKGAVSLAMGIENIEFDEVSPEFQDHLLRVGTVYNLTIGRQNRG